MCLAPWIQGDGKTPQNFLQFPHSCSGMSCVCQSHMFHITLCCTGFPGSYMVAPKCKWYLGWSSSCQGTWNLSFLEIEESECLCVSFGNWEWSITERWNSRSNICDCDCEWLWLCGMDNESLIMLNQQTSLLNLLRLCNKWTMGIPWFNWLWLWWPTVQTTRKPKQHQHHYTNYCSPCFQKIFD